MDSKEFAGILVQELVDKNLPDSRLFISANGIDASNLDDADVIWKAFVRYNVDAGGIKSSIVDNYWNELSEDALIKQRESLIDSIMRLKQLQCYCNFTFFCPVTYKAGEFINAGECFNKPHFNKCPVVELINELHWHRGHYKIAKIIVEDAKRLLIEDRFGKINGNLNDFVDGILKIYSQKEDGNVAATKELLSTFENMKGYGNPPKAVTWFFSEFSSPIHQINHWPELDYKQFNPVDTHVRRLMVRLGFIDEEEASNKNIDEYLNEIYPEEPRKLDFALYRLGGESEEDICGITPNCELCKERHPVIWENCRIPSMELIKNVFDNRFDHWKIKLPEGDLITRQSGYINQAGWLIQYCFGEDGEREYMDYYATHRMTNDSHVRIYADGTKESLPTLSSWYLVSKDPIEAKKLKDKYYQRNNEVSKMLANKGFSKFTINMYLRAELDKKK